MDPKDDCFSLASGALILQAWEGSPRIKRDVRCIGIFDLTYRKFLGIRFLEHSPIPDQEFIHVPIFRLYLK